MKKNILLVVFLLSLSYSLASADDPKQKFQGFNLQGYTDTGEKSWDVKGDTADIKGSEIEISNVDANSYGDNKMNVTAETGMVDQTSGQMRLEKDVIVTSAEGAQLMTDTLSWSRDDDVVSTQDDVLITDEGYTVTGKGMKAKPGLKTAKIDENVTVRVDTDTQDEQSGTVTITSDGPMVIDQAQFMATFEDNVIAVQEDRTLKADKMEVYFNEGMNEIQKLICIGNVFIKQGSNNAVAEQAIYDAVTQKFMLLGRPKLKMITEGEGAITSFGD